MKTLKFILATLAVSFAFSATAFADQLSNDYNYTFDLSVEPATVNAGETIEVSVFLSATDASGNPVASLAETTNTDSMTLSLGLDYDDSVLTWVDNDTDGMYTDTKYDGVDFFYSVVDNGGNLGLVLTEQYRKIGAINPDTVVLTYKFKVADNAATATYDSSNPLVALKADTTSYANSTKVTSTLNKTLNVPTVNVKGAAPQGPTAEKVETATNGISKYTVSTGETVMMSQTFTQQDITEATRFVVTWNGEKKVFGSDLYAKLGGQGGSFKIGSLTFGVVVDDANANASDFTFEIK